jgi:predicted nucleic acid-binding protein
MIVLDTNVISEFWKAKPNPNVLVWMDAQAVETLYLSAITVAELRYGLAIMPEGKRRAAYQKAFEQAFLPMFAGRVLPFDLHVSQTYAGLMARAKAQGIAVSKEDGYIAATAAIHGLMVATRDMNPFKAAGLSVINPWEIMA